MYIRIKDVGTINENDIYLLVEFWGSAEDRFLGLTPFLTNDFILPCQFDPINEISRYSKRIYSQGYYGNHHNLSISKNREASPEFIQLIGKEMLV